MNIRRYKERIATDWILDAEMGDWCRYEDVEPLLERIKELEERQCDCAIPTKQGLKNE